MGKFFYINTSPHGEIIGGAVGYDLRRNPDKLTMYIDNSNLSAKHAHIQLNSHGQYFIQDISDDNFPGIWVKVPTSGEGIDLYRNRNFERHFMIKSFQYMFEFRAEDQVLKDFYHWMRLNQIDKIYSQLEKDGIDTFSKFFKNFNDLQADYELRKDYATKIVQKAEELQNIMQYIPNSRSRMENGPKKELQCVFTQWPEIQFNLNGYQGYLLGNQNNQNANVKINDQDLDSLSTYIVFKHGSYYMVSDHSESNLEETWKCESPYFSVFKDEKFNIQPGMILQMGSLTYQVQRFNTGIIADVGARGSMEDTYVAVQDLGIDDYMKISLFAAIDGHGGYYCAQFLRQNLESEVRRQLTDITHGLKSDNGEGVNHKISNALKNAFINLDEQFYTEKPEIAHKCGAAMVCVLIVGNRIFCANVGDSRAVLSRNGKAINLSFDHKTTRVDEQERIRLAGGSINCGRVMDKLAITRAFGDFELKVIPRSSKIERKNYITSEPEIRYFEIDPSKEDEFIVMGSDGLFDKFSSQDVVNYIRQGLQQMPPLEQNVQKIAREITDECIYQKEVRDNITTIIVALNRGIKQQL